jgi:uncharacterized protein (DUF1499 family)
MERGPGRVGRAGSLRAASTFAILGAVLALSAALASAAAGGGSRLDWWSFRTGFVILRWATYLAIAAGVVCLTGCVFSSFAGRWTSFSLAVAGLALAVFLVGTVTSWRMLATSVPMIHDIATDTANPPSFVAVLALRQNAPNPAEYGGPKVAELQHQAYPDIQPVQLAVPPHTAFERALSAARVMGWETVDANESQGRIEATATTTWFHFKDDIVIRITGTKDGSRVDVRSVSRVGKSDLGTNARRIRAYVKVLREGTQ